jgi:hypothetical protein
VLVVLLTLQQTGTSLSLVECSLSLLNAWVIIQRLRSGPWGCRNASSNRSNQHVHQKLMCCDSILYMPRARWPPTVLHDRVSPQRSLSLVS